MSCGWGVQTRRVHCAVKQTPEVPVDNALCADVDVGLAPPSQQNCNSDPCPVYSYAFKAWSACSVTCGTGGVQTRLTWCQSSTQSAPETPVPPLLCGTLGPAPPSTQSCSGQQPCQYSFNSSRWSGCSATCGLGEQTRQVYCADQAGRSVTDSLCLTDANATKPASKQACTQSPCVFSPLKVTATSAADRCVPFLGTMLLVPLLVLSTSSLRTKSSEEM